MSWHRAFDVVVLLAALLGGAAGAVLVLVPLVFGEVPGRLRRSRPLLLSMIGVAVVLLLLEWLVFH